MKLYNLKTFISIATIFQLVLTSGTVLKNFAQNKDCPNSCQICQRVVYQLKFQQIADCEVDGVCRGTCEKIREAWGSPFNPFEAFVKDVFGKCEICFRAGHCSISQCKEQEHNELEIINHIVNSATLTAKINPDLIVNYPTANPDDVPKTKKTNVGIEKEISKDLKHATTIGTTEELLPKVQNLINNYLVDPYHTPSVGAVEILNYNSNESANIPYYTSNATEKLVQKTKDNIDKLDKNLKNLDQLSKEAPRSEIKNVKKETMKTEKDIEKLESKYEKAENKLNKQANNLNKLANQVDPKSRADLQNTLLNVKNAAKAAKDAKEALKKDKEVFAKFR